jgi:hypothetical protein
MRSHLLPAQTESTRQSRRVAAPPVLPVAVVLVLSACMGGQTGTEYTPDAGTRSGENQGTTTGAVPSDDSSKNGSSTAGGTSSPTPVDASYGTCDASTSTLDGLTAKTGLSTSAVLDFVKTAAPLSLRYDASSETGVNMDLTVRADSCVPSASGSGGLPSLSVPVTVTLASDDLRLKLALPLGEITGSAAAGGGVGGAALTASLQCDDGSQLASSLSACSIAGIDESAYARVNIDLSLRMESIAGMAAVLGSLRVTGNRVVACADVLCSSGQWELIATMAVTGGAR